MTSPPRPNLKEIQQFVKDLRDPVNQEYGGFNARAADLIESLLSERDWQPIETAPKDARVLVFNGDKVRLARTNNGYGWAASDGFGWVKPEPTHWMPLPDPPARAMRGNAE